MSVIVGVITVDTPFTPSPSEVGTCHSFSDDRLNQRVTLRFVGEALLALTCLNVTAFILLSRLN